MKTLLAVTLAAIYGLSVRLLYGFLDSFMGIMSTSFLVMMPVIIGFLTVILVPLRVKISGAGAFFLPWLTSLVILAITVASDVEGAICWAMLFPLFVLLAGIGGLIANSVRNRRIKRNDDGDKFDVNRGRMALPLLLVLPLVTGVIEGDRTLTPKHYTLEKEVVIAASPAQVWHAIANINSVAPGEKHTAFTNALGFPHHLRTTLDTLAIGGRRKAIYEGGLYFDETITRYEPERLMALAIKTDPKNIPPTVLDEHIVIGGKHVDIMEDVYRLEPLPDGRSRLILSTRYMISTPFNWYAGIWADWLMGDLLSGELELIKSRAGRHSQN